ncbi:MAG TPA: hypothetical protein P5250_01020 [Bacteroidales bacterium]|nr:hypothetical protein [Bacteroidales bacterium]
MNLLIKKLLKLCFYYFLLTITLNSFNHVAAQALKYSNEFMSLGVGARALGMSNAVLSSTNDVTSGYWNPANLVFITSNLQVGLMHSEYFAGIAKYDYAAIAAKIDEKSALCFSYIRFGIDDIPNTIDLVDNQGNIDFTKISSFSAVDNAFLFSYARKNKNKKINYGGNVKIIYRHIGDFAKAWGFGLDAGINYNYNNWLFAITGKDITSTFNIWDYDLPQNMKDVFLITGNDIPTNSTEITVPKLLAGISKNFQLKNNFYFMPEINFDFTFDKKRNVLVKSNLISIDPKVGIEVNYKNIIYYRAGIGNFQKETNNENKKITTFQPNMGLGIVIKKSLFIDYALTDIGDKSIALYSNVFSIKININKKSDIKNTQ